MKLEKSAPIWAFPHPDGAWYGDEHWRAPGTKQCQHGIHWRRGIGASNRLLWYPEMDNQEGLTCPCMGLCVKHERPNLIPGEWVQEQGRGYCNYCAAPPGWEADRHEVAMRRSGQALIDVKPKRKK